MDVFHNLNQLKSSTYLGMRVASYRGMKSSLRKIIMLIVLGYQAVVLAERATQPDSYIRVGTQNGGKGEGYGYVSKPNLPQLPANPTREQLAQHNVNNANASLQDLKYNQEKINQAREDLNKQKEKANQEKEAAIKKQDTEGIKKATNDLETLKKQEEDINLKQKQTDFNKAMAQNQLAQGTQGLNAIKGVDPVTGNQMYPAGGPLPEIPGTSPSTPSTASSPSTPAQTQTGDVVDLKNTPTDYTKLGEVDPKADWATRPDAPTVVQQQVQQPQTSAPNLSDTKSFSETADKGYLKNATDKQTYFQADDGSIYRTPNSEYAKSFSNGTAGTDQMMKGLELYDSKSNQWLKWDSAGSGMTSNGQYQHSFVGENGKTLTWNSASNGNIARVSAPISGSTPVKLSKINNSQVVNLSTVAYGRCGPNGCSDH
jgi:hypothetical protein